MAESKTMRLYELLSMYLNYDTEMTSRLFGWY
jgi:hypothetical protein